MFAHYVLNSCACSCLSDQMLGIPTKKKKEKDQKKSIHKYDLWNFPEVRPAKSVIRKLFAESLAIACKQIMNNHVNEFAKNVHVQQNEGSIGVMFTGIAAEIKMLT